MRVTAVRRERLGDITKEDVRREGYPSVKAYREAFERIYGYWDPDSEVWVVGSSWLGNPGHRFAILSGLLCNFTPNSVKYSWQFSYTGRLRRQSSPP
ncbi:hypothetical protein G7K71_09000 [Desulfofundulus sp. TPOSR]|nr:hypothetical protein [Desulfofundulus sp. TPOSR]